MRTRQVSCAQLLGALVVATVLSSTSSAQLAIDWYTIDGGGGESAGGIFSLTSTIGQADAGAVMAGGVYTLTGGFLAGHVGPVCGSADYNNDGDTGTDLDIEAFFACLAGTCCATCPPNADFDGDGDVGTDLDIEAFFRVLGGGTC